MGGNEVYRSPGLSAALVEYISGSCNTFGQLGHHTRIAFPELSYGVAELVIPFGPSWRELPDLVPTGADIPRFGNEFDARQDRVLAAGVKKPAAFIEPVGLAS